MSSRIIRSAHDKFFSKVSVQDDGCHIWTAYKNRAGYGEFNLTGNSRVGGRSMWFAHRVAWEWANGPIPGGLYVCHSCDTPACVNPSHLFLGTQFDNLRDMTAKGRRARGERSAKSNLKERDVLEIRASKLTDTELSRVYGIARGAIYHIRKGNRWKHVGVSL